MGERIKPITTERSHTMRTNTRATIASGIVITLILSGAWWYVAHRPQPSPPAKTMTEEMPGMTMGGTQMEGMSDEPSASSSSGGGSGDGLVQATVMVSPAKRQLIGVKTDTVQERTLETVIRAVGTVDYDERHIRQVNLRVSGWITNLFVDYTGKSVKRGDPLFTLYSPDLVSTQEEYLLAKRTLERVTASPVMHVRTGAEAQVASAKNRLLLWGLTEAQIAELEERGTPQKETTIDSPIHGVVTKKTALQGMYVTPEMNLYEITDLSTVWINADVYEYEVPLVKVEQEAAVTLTAYPGEAFHGRVMYIYPYLNAETRTIKVRMEFPNPEGKLKPGMYGTVEIKTTAGKKLAIPQEAVLDSGTRKLVFVDKGQGMYEPREVQLGNKVDRFYPILSGLNPGDRVVTSATFLIDSESKLMAATNMMGALGMGGIRMEQAQMGQMTGQMEMAGMEGMKGMEGMPMDQSSSGGSTAREQTVDGLTLTLATVPDPPKKGENTLRLLIRSKDMPVTDAKVTVAYIMAMPGMEPETVEAKQTKEGMYEATVDFAMKGGWAIDVTVVRGKAKPVTAHFTVQVGT
jgi:Cu(I)/Ag(I) efflux system membrane fusion protein